MCVCCGGETVGNMCVCCEGGNGDQVAPGSLQTIGMLIPIPTFTEGYPDVSDVTFCGNMFPERTMERHGPPEIPSKPLVICVFAVRMGMGPNGILLKLLVT